ncbi:hypothetical protein [Caulobacter soli]|uniref:hypothetical protein n=1 Tax=Caulobacter soli TaxID=2708539 RepID=UPI0013EA88CF|nr:hypothetical protein [Caulobacter soli]
MQLALVAAIAVHVLAATFWAGSTFALARMAGKGSQQLFFPQLIAAALAIAAGAYLWHALHGGPFGTAEQVLAVGAGAALVALAVQATVVGGALRHEPGPESKPPNRARLIVGHRAAAVLLAIAAAAMAAARYV